MIKNDNDDFSTLQPLLKLTTYRSCCQCNMHQNATPKSQRQQTALCVGGKMCRYTCGKCPGLCTSKSHRCTRGQLAWRWHMCAYNKLCHDVINMEAYLFSFFSSAAIYHPVKQRKALDSSVTFAWTGSLTFAAL